MSQPRNFTWDLGEAMALEALPYDPTRVLHVRPMGMTEEAVADGVRLLDSLERKQKTMYLVYAASFLALLYILRKK